MAAADPTLETLERLEDPNLYTRLANVPIFAPHQRKLRDGTILTVDERRLRLIADVARQRQDGPGSLVRLTLGHVLLARETPEPRQPRPVGFARITSVGPFGPGHQPALLSDWFIRCQDYAEAATYPFRSAEFLADSNTITGVALLRRDPELDLGLLTYDSQRRCLTYSMCNQSTPTRRPKMPTAAELPRLIFEAKERQAQVLYERGIVPDLQAGRDMVDTMIDDSAPVAQAAAKRAAGVSDDEGDPNDPEVQAQQMAKKKKILAYAHQTGCNYADAKDAIEKLEANGTDTDSPEVTYARSGSPISHQASQELHSTGPRQMPSESETRLHRAAIDLATQKNISYASAKKQLRGY
jgi:hypothetical protein